MVKAQGTFFRLLFAFYKQEQNSAPLSPVHVPQLKRKKAGCLVGCFHFYTVCPDIPNQRNMSKLKAL